MIIYQGTKRQFSEDVINNVIADKLERHFRLNNISGGTIAEERSWLNSLPRMEMVLRESRIPDDCEVALEYQIPTTAKRIDFMVAGKDDDNKNYIYVIELKQWEEAKKTALNDCVETFTGGRERIVQHPCTQVYNYTKLLENVNASIQEQDIRLKPLCYLHNFKEKYIQELESKEYEFYVKEVPLFYIHDTLKLSNYIKQHIKNKPDPRLFELIDHGKLKPSKALQDAILPMLDGKSEFYMIDEQQVAYSYILKLVENSLKNNKKYTIVVQGGPGTGKSVIAVSLLAKLIKDGYSTSYVSKNSAPRNVYSKLLVDGHKRLNYVKGLFKGSGSFCNEDKNKYDCLLVDEAHRLNDKSGLYRNLGKNQIMEIIHSSRVSVFFLDEEQIVHVNDIGSVDEIRKWAKYENSEFKCNDQLILTSQFRCNGSNAYIAFLDNLLQIRETANNSIEDLDYDFRVYDDPNKMREDLRKLNEVNNKARMLSGYTYDWKSKKDPEAMDINLSHDFHAQWNFSSTSTWAIDKDSFKQVGCIHTSQGLEFDYVGAIIGKDLRFENGKVITDVTKRSKSDASVHGLSKKENAVELADRIIRDTYKVLMTRGQKGCYIYCEDKALAEYIKTRSANQRNSCR